MASTYTPAGIELIADGEQSNTWGQTANENFELLEELIAGVVSVSLSSTTYTLTTTDGVTSNGRHAVVIFTGSPGGTCTVTVSPNDMQKVYFIKNSSDQTVTITQGSGANVSITANSTQIIYCDGAGASAAVNTISGSEFSTLKATNFYLGGTQVTATAAELNVLDGITSTTTELNALDGFNGVAADLNYAKDLRNTGVSTSEFDVLDGITSTTAELNKLDGYTGDATHLNYLVSLYNTGVTNTEFDALDGVTSAIQTQLNNKQPLDADLTALGALAKTDGNFIVGNGSTWVVESGSTARSSLGLANSATQTYTISTSSPSGGSDGDVWYKVS